MELLIATSNRHKHEEMSAILSEFGISLKMRNVPMVEPDSGTLEEISEYKARQAFAQLKKPVVCEDTGVYFDAYNQFPGVLAKRVFIGLGFDGLIALIKNKKNKKAHFTTAVTYCDGKAMKTFTGSMEGRLLEGAVSVDKDRLPYEKIFVPKGFTKALVDIPLLEKNKISHRAIATKKLGDWLLEHE